MIEKFKEAFKEEAVELLSQLEDALLELEQDPTNKEVIASVFRTMHTIKGSASMFGFEKIAHFTHEMESIMELLRQEVFVPDKTFISMTLEARDFIEELLKEERQDILEQALTFAERFKQHIEKLSHQKGASPSEEKMVAQSLPGGEGKDLPEEGPKVPSVATGSISSPPPTEAGSKVTPPPSLETYRIQLLPHRDIFKSGVRLLLILDELSRLGTMSLIARKEDIPPLSVLNEEECFVGWDITLSTDKGEDAIRDVFIFVEDRADIKIEKVSVPEKEGEKNIKRLGEILVERGVTSPTTIESLEAEKKRLGELLVEKKLVSEEDVRSALLEQEHLKHIRERQELSTNSIRVPSERLDTLVDLVGELVTLQARLASLSLGIRDANLVLLSEQMERLVAQLRDTAMGIRMLPIGTTFSRFRRLVRDLSQELGKEVELVTEGGDTELDKTVIEKLNDPLVHIIRNSVDHGIERPLDRQARGKPPQGTIRLSAFHSGAYVLIQVSDDGAGLNREKILEKAIEKGLLNGGTNYSDEEIFQCIFAPGFSTASQVTSVSGRGVGMDVVKRHIESLGGMVSIDSAQGKGTTVTLRIPLTLAIIDGLLVRIGQDNFVIPLSAVDGCIEIASSERINLEKHRAMLSYRNMILPFITLRTVLEIPGNVPDIEQIVVVTLMEKRIGFVVDQVIGDNQTVIKPLGPLFKNVPIFSGASILGDGSIALIIDIPRLCQYSQKMEEPK
ncbi:MAG: chemotaxis protein CheA [Treponemataceae bacterium]|nr:chemotaxis protein CheA [Treponemataceae bacterium]